MSHKIDMPELKILSSAVLTQATANLNAELQELLLQKERIERQLNKKSHTLQSTKHQLFTIIEELLREKGADNLSISKLHSIELQSMDLLNLLEEMVESAIITTLEKGSNIEETLEELAKEITIQTLDEGILSAERIRHVISTILRTAIEVAEASPNSAPAILEGTIKGMRTGLIRSLDNFNKKFLFTPDEAKMILIDDPHALYNELHHTDALFLHTIEALAAQSSPTIKSELKMSLQIYVMICRSLCLSPKRPLTYWETSFLSLPKRQCKKALTCSNQKKHKKLKRWVSMHGV